MIPTAVLRDRITIRPFVGQAGEGGAVYGTPATQVPARLVGKRQSVRTSEGVDIIAAAVVQIRPGRPVPVQSLVTLGDEVYEVADVAHAEELSRPHHDDLILDGPRPAAVPT